MDTLDFLDADASGDAARAPAARDDSGRFAAPAQEQAAPAEAAPTPQLNTATPPEPTTAPADPYEGPTPPGHVPLSALLDTRDKAKAAEERARLAEERIAAIEAERQRPAAQAPDRYADPDAYDDFREAQMAQALRAQAMEIAQIRAEGVHGAELVKAAREWAKERCDQDPFFNQRMFASADPFGEAIAEYQQAQALSALSDPEKLRAFNEWQAGQSAAPAPSSPAASEPQPAPPRSLASAPAAGSAKPGQQPVGPGVAFDALFSQ